MASAQELVVLLKAVDQLSPALKSIQGNLSQFDGALSASGRAVSTLGTVVAAGAAAAGAGMAAGLVKGIQAAADIEKSVANISTIKPDIDTSAVFASLNEMSTRVPQTAGQLGDSLYNVFSSIETTQGGALQLVEQFAKGAVGAQTDAATFGSSVLGVMNAYGQGVDQASHISDVFFNTVKNGVITGQELAQNLGPVTQSAKSAGVSLDVLGGLIAGVTKEGGPAAQNVNNLNNFLQKVTTGPAQKALSELGVVTKDAAGNFRPVMDVLGDLKTQLGPLSESAKAAALQDIFPDAQARQGAQTLLSQLDFVKQAIDDNVNSAGAAEAAFQAMNNTFSAQLGQLGNAMTAVLAAIGAEILPTLTPIIAGFAQQLPAAFAAAREAIGPVASAIGAGIAALASAAEGPIQTLKDAFGTIGQVFQGNWAPDAAAIQPFTNAVGIAAMFVRDQLLPAIMSLGTFLGEHMEIVAGFGAALLALGAAAAIAGTIAGVAAAVALLVSPIGLIVIAIGLLTAAWVGNWGDIQGITASAGAAIGAAITAIGDFFNGLGEAAAGVVTAITGAWDGAVSATTGAWDAVGAAVQAAWDLIIVTVAGAATGILSAVQGAWDAVTGAIQGALDAIGTAITTAWETIFDAETRAALANLLTEFQTTWDAISSLISAVLTVIGDAIRTAWDTVLTTTQTVWNTISTALSTAWTTISTTIGTALTTLGTTIQTAWNTIKTTIDTAMTNIKTALDTAWAAIVTTAATLLTPIIAAVQEKFDAAKTAIEGSLRATATAVSSAWNSIVSTVSGILQGLVDSAAGFGRGMVNAFAKGITDNLSSALGAARKMAQDLRDLLPHSDAKTGPLSDLTQSGRAFAETLAAGMRSGAPALLREMRSMANAMAPTPMAYAGSAVLSRPAAEHFSSSSGARGGDTHLHFNVNAPIYGVNDMEDVVIRALDRAGRRGRI